MALPSDFAQATIHLRVLEKRILKSADIPRLEQTDGFGETYGALARSCSVDFSATPPELFETALKAELKKTYGLLAAISPEPYLTDVLGRKYDFHNLKAAMKLKILNRIGKDDAVFIEATETSSAVIAQAVDKEDASLLPEHLREPYEDAKRNFSAKGDPQELALVLDCRMFAQMGERAEKTECEMIRDYVKVYVDLYNIKTLRRAKLMNKPARFLSAALAEGGDITMEYFLSAYDKQAEHLDALAAEKGKRLTELVNSAKYVAFGPEPLFAFLLAKEEEINRVRLILSRKRTETSRKRAGETSA